MAKDNNKQKQKKNAKEVKWSLSQLKVNHNYIEIRSMHKIDGTMEKKRKL